MTRHTAMAIWFLVAIIALLLAMSCSIVEIRHVCIRCSIPPDYEVVKIDTLYYEGGGSVKQVYIRTRKDAAKYKRRVHRATKKQSRGDACIDEEVQGVPLESACELQEAGTSVLSLHAGIL